MLIRQIGFMLGGTFILSVILSVLSVPLVAKSAIAANLVVNGSFEEIALPNRSWTVFPYTPGNSLPHGFSSIPGWNVSPGLQFEVQNQIAGTAAQGFQLVELDASFTQKGNIYQDILTKPGQNYLLKFAFSSRPGTGILDNILQIKWGTNIVDTIFANGIGLSDTAWKYYTYNLVATTDKTRIDFSDLGSPNHVGTYIDDVSVESVEAVPEPTTMFGTLAFGAVVSRWRMKRKQQQL